jgi:hypothetical protein
VSGSKAHRKEGHSAEVVTHNRPESGDGGEMVWTETVKDPRQKNGQQQHAVPMSLKTTCFKSNQMP